MLTDQEIQHLIVSPKEIVKKTPNRGYGQKNSSMSCDLHLKGTGEEETSFIVYIRQNAKFIENYSIGVRYRTEDEKLGIIILVRYNGPHGETSRAADGHYAKTHTHRITHDDLLAGNTNPQERDREITDRYSTFEDALRVFFGDINIQNWTSYFPGLENEQLSMFDGH